MTEHTSEYFVVHDAIPKAQQDQIEKLTSDSRFPWFFSEGTILPDDIEQNPWVVNVGANPIQFVHNVSPEHCAYIDTVSPVFNAIAMMFRSNLEIIRAKFNLLTQSSDQTHHLPHTDTDQNNLCYTSIYYVDDSDGDTYLFNEHGPRDTNGPNEVTVLDTVPPTKGSLLVFDARRFHSSSSPVISHKRTVMNVVFKVKNT